MKLNQVVAVVTGMKTRTQKALTELYKRVQKPDLFNGLSRTYQPLDEEGETFPPESKLVQAKVSDCLFDARQILVDLWDTIATQDDGNTIAKVNVTVDGVVLLQSVSVPHLLYLEKQMMDLHTFVQALPVLDPAERWEYSENLDCYVTPPTTTNRQKKVPRHQVTYDATPEHPAQVHTYHEDVKVGEWSMIKHSGAMPLARKKVLLERIINLKDAIKIAREKANQQEVEKVRYADNVFEYLFHED